MEEFGDSGVEVSMSGDRDAVAQLAGILRVECGGAGCGWILKP